MIRNKDKFAKQREDFLRELHRLGFKDAKFVPQSDFIKRWEDKELLIVK